MKRFLYWRKMTWVILLFIAAMAVWMIRGEFVLIAFVTAFGLVGLSVLWFSTRPLWRVGHGARLRPMRSVAIPFKNVDSITPSPR
jgi:hypothetical protein